VQEDLEWAELVTIDLAKFDSPEGRRELVDVLVSAVREKGYAQACPSVRQSVLTVEISFFYVKNFNIDQELVNRQFALGREFYELPLEEKQKYTPAGLGMQCLFSVKGQRLTSTRPGRVQWLRSRRPSRVSLHCDLCWFTR
jgi:isopenicillin N synthase-like dioxygenase